MCLRVCVFEFYYTRQKRGSPVVGAAGGGDRVLVAISRSPTLESERNALNVVS